MVIDFHTHAFPDKIAQKTVDLLKEKSKTVPFTNGTVGGLSEKARNFGIDLSVVLPVVTNPLSTDKINDFAAETNKNTEKTGFLRYIYKKTPFLESRSLKSECSFLNNN